MSELKANLADKAASMELLKQLYGRNATRLPESTNERPHERDQASNNPREGVKFDRS